MKESMKSTVTETIEIMQRADIYRTHILLSLTTSPRFTYTPTRDPAGHDARDLDSVSQFKITKKEARTGRYIEKQTPDLAKYLIMGQTL